jgi:glycosyltransferase involved in cell wall biosynthesis
MSSNILIIIPAYNEEKNISGVIDGLQKEVPFADILVINDGSSDHTLAIVKERHIPCINLPYNMGIGTGVQTGYKYAANKGYEIAVQVDGDGQHDVRYIKDLVEPILAGKAQVVIGSRYISRGGFQSTFWRRIGSTYLSWLISLTTGQKISDPTSGFRAVSKEVIALFAQGYPPDYPEPEALVMLARKHFITREIPVEMKERALGKSSINPLSAIYYMIKVSFAIMIDKMRR